MKEQDGPWYLTDHAVADADGRDLIFLARSDWADWLPSGDLVFAKQGKLFRVRHAAGRFAFDEPPHLIADLSAQEFRERKAPADALRWSEPPRGAV